MPKSPPATPSEGAEPQRSPPSSPAPAPVPSTSWSSDFPLASPSPKIKGEEGSAERRRMAAGGGNSLRATAAAGRDLTDAMVEDPEEDADALVKGRKRPWPEGRNAPEMGDGLGGGAFTSPVIDEGGGHQSGGKAKIAVLAHQMKQENTSDDDMYSGITSGSRVRRKTLGEDFSPVQSATKEEDDEIGVNVDVEMSEREEVGKHLGNADGSEGNNSSGIKFVSRREANRARAIESAPKYALFKENVDGEGNKARLNKEGEGPDVVMPDVGEEEFPGPFSAAMNIIRQRNEKLRDRNLSSSKNESTKLRIKWKPSKDGLRSCPTLIDKCMDVLVNNAEEIESLEGIPTSFKNRLILMLCRVRKMSYGLLDHLVISNSTEIHLSDCSWATEAQFQAFFMKRDTKILKVVQLDLSGRCMPDHVLRSTLARSPNSLPMLTSLSLKGAYSLSNNGLNAIASSAPSLRSINLSQCSLVTSLGIINLAENLDCVLRKLYIDDCQNVDAMEILPALKKLKHLEVLSLAGMQSVSHDFVHGLIPVCGSNLREFCLDGCGKVTNASIKIISEHCPSLCAIDLRNINELTDSALEYLANGCRSLQKLKLRRSAFSDEAVGAFLEASGSSLIELVLNNIEQVAEHTALAISKRCSSTLQNLDLSFCREMTDEALGIIVDKCSRLKILKLFGCTQVTDKFLDGHKNCSVNVIGLKKIADGIELPEFF